MQELGVQLRAAVERHVRWVVVACVAVGVGTRLAPLLHSQAAFKGLVESMNAADAFIKGANALHSPSPSNLFLLSLTGAKAFVKSAKMKKICKGLKASEGALNVVRYSGVLRDGAGDPLEQAVKGYKWTKGAFNVLDGVKGAGGYGGVKEGMKGVDVVVKAMALSKRVHRALTEGFKVSDGVFRMVGEELKNDKKQEKRVWKRRARQGEMVVFSDYI